MNRWFEIAEESSKKSEYPRINIGAALVLGNYLVATGYNQKKSHPRQAILNNAHKDFHSNHFLHAEVHTLIRSGRTDIRGADLYVFRKDKLGNLANCRPCVSCMAAIREAGISRVYYTTNDGYFYETLTDG